MLALFETVLHASNKIYEYIYNCMIQTFVKNDYRLFKDSINRKTIMIISNKG